MDGEEGVELLLLGYILSDDELWEAHRRREDAEEPPAKKKCWVRPWIQVRDNDESNTMYKLQLELSKVGRARSQMTCSKFPMITNKKTSISPEGKEMW